MSTYEALPWYLSQIPVRLWC
ncbi:BnaCnng52370D [Brassica napus]|uniref:BnaCnng52370D protein n=1 Tax=Brassica napus TaxID=3708 RepID=A0A078JK39_BRANA|nr:BnaCnng52370D [Brassica napus]